MKYEIEPVGYIRKNEEDYFIEFKDKYKVALNGLDGFSHLNVLWWCHLHDSKKKRKMMSFEKLYKKGPEDVGTFSTRAPIRPNPIALSIISVKSLDNENGIINISSIDAKPGTPVIDIKPYHPSIDRVKNVSVPSWCLNWPKWIEDAEDFDWASKMNV